MGKEMIEIINVYGEYLYRDGFIVTIEDLRRIKYGDYIEQMRRKEEQEICGFYNTKINPLFMEIIEKRLAIVIEFVKAIREKIEEEYLDRIIIVNNKAEWK